MSVGSMAAQLECLIGGHIPSDQNYILSLLFPVPCGQRAGSLKGAFHVMTGLWAALTLYGRCLSCSRPCVCSVASYYWLTRFTTHAEHFSARPNSNSDINFFHGVGQNCVLPRHCDPWRLLVNRQRSRSSHHEIRPPNASFSGVFV